jgi:HSP20 family protein
MNNIQRHHTRRFFPLIHSDLLRGWLPRYFEDWHEKDWLAKVGSMRSDLKETDTAFIVEAELPGFKKEDISVEYKNSILMIEAKREEETKEEKENFIKRERYYGEASRSFMVEGIKSDAISAEYKDGVLTVNMPKIEPGAEEKKKIEIT